MSKTMSGHMLYALFSLLILISAFNPVSAQVDLPDSIVVERIQLIRKMLGRGESGAKWWWYGWLAGYSAATVGQSVVWISSYDKDTRQDMAVGAATTLLGAAGQLLTPNTPGRAADRLDIIPGDTRDSRLLKLQKAEELLKESALREKAGRSWKMHAITGAVNLTSGLITWLGFNRNVWAGVGNFALNTIITETQIWTQPTRAIRDYNDYCRRFNTGKEAMDMKSGVIWLVSASPGGIRLKIIF